MGGVRHDERYDALKQCRAGTNGQGVQEQAQAKAQGQGARDWTEIEEWPRNPAGDRSVGRSVGRLPRRQFCRLPCAASSSEAPIKGIEQRPSIEPPSFKPAFGPRYMSA